MGSFTTAEKALIDEVIYEQIIEYMDNLDISKEIYPLQKRNEGDAIKIVKEGKWPEAKVVAEGTEVPIYEPEYSVVTKVYKKIGYRTQITHEMITDARWDLVRRGARKAGEKLALKMSIDVLRDAWGGAGHTFTVTGRWGGAYSDELSDIANVIAKIRNVNYLPDKLVLNPLDYAHLATLEVFIHKEKGGDVRQYDTGKTLLGLDVLVTPMMSENNFLMLDQDMAGIFFEREGLRKGSYTDVPRDVEGQVFFIRYIPGVIAPSAICFATGYA